MRVLVFLLLAMIVPLYGTAQDESPAAKLKKIEARHRKLVFEERKELILKHIDSLRDLKEQYLKDGERSDARKVDEAIAEAKRDLKSIPVFGNTTDPSSDYSDESKPALALTAPIPSSAQVFKAEDATLKSVRYDKENDLLVDWTEEDSRATWTIPINGISKGNYDLFLFYSSRVKDFKIRIQIGNRDIQPSLPLTPSRRRAKRGWLGVYRHANDEEVKIEVSTLEEALEEPFRIQSVALVKRQ